MRPFLAMIVPMGEAGEPPGTWGGSGQPFPTPPIHMPPGQGGGGSPPGTWGGSGEPFPGYGLPGQPPGTWGGRPPPYPDHTLPGDLPHPSHPIAPGGRPPGTWGGSGQPFPTPPIYIPPEGGQPPLGIWGPTDPRPGYGLPGAQPKPEHPIVLPPELPPETPETGPIDWKLIWTPMTGWAVIGIPTGPHPSPAKK